VTADRFDVAIVGGGLVGLATAHRLLEARPGLRVAVLEKEAEVAAHQSGRNSGVLHAGLYYAPGSLKARWSAEGKAALERFAEAEGVRFERCGKLVVALETGEVARLEAVRNRAVANAVPGVEIVGPERIREIEPHAVGVRAIWSPGTGIIDFRGVALALARLIRERGGQVLTSREVTGLRQAGREVVIATPAGDVIAGGAIACAGLQADRVAAMTADPGASFMADSYSRLPSWKW
jgi:L-2-hydroxyglutarate oxidase LhgO